MRRIGVIGAVVMVALTCLIILGGLWWWALIGMSEDVGSAWVGTGFVTAFLAVIFFGLAVEP